MARRPLRTLVTSKVAVGATAIALLGGGAAIAAEGEVLTTDPAAEIDSDDGQDTDAQDEDAGDTDVSEEEQESGTPGTAGSSEVEPVEESEVDDDVGELVIDEDVGESEKASDDDGPGWALGNAEDVDEVSQADRIDAFCDARRGEEEEAATTDETDDADEAAEAVGVPPFCDVQDAQGPNAHGQATAAQARDGKTPANSNRPSQAGPPTDSDGPDASVEGLDGDDPDEDPVTTDAEPAEAQRTGPSANANAHANANARANARANRDR